MAYRGRDFVVNQRKALLRFWLSFVMTAESAVDLVM